MKKDEKSSTNKDPIQNEAPRGLCYRCEYRAQYLEKGHAPRMECGMTDSAVMGCYMFKPVKPPTLKRMKGDNRYPVPGLLMSARVERVADSDRLIQFTPQVKFSEDDENSPFAVYFIPGKGS